VADNQRYTVREKSSFTRLAAAVLALAVGLTFTAPPLAAAESSGQPSSSPSLSGRGSAVAASAARLAARPLPARALRQTAPAAGSDDGRGFFQRPAGVAALVLMGVGLGLMVRSAFKDNDPVHSQYR
jgi:hypothetical protein